MIFIGDRKKFIHNLKNLRFTYGKLKRKNQIVLKKAIVEDPQNINDFVVLDICFSDEQDIYEILKNKINFTINGFALNVQYIFNENWMKKMIKLPHSVNDIKSKQLRLR